MIFSSSGDLRNVFLGNLFWSYKMVNMIFSSVTELMNEFFGELLLVLPRCGMTLFEGGDFMSCSMFFFVSLVIERVFFWVIENCRYVFGGILRCWMGFFGCWF